MQLSDSARLGGRRREERPGSGDDLHGEALAEAQRVGLPFCQQEALTAAARARVAARETAHLLAIFELLLRIMQRGAVCRLRRHMQESHYNCVLHCLAVAFCRARALNRWAEYHHECQDRPRMLMRAAVATASISRGAAWRRWVRQASRWRSRVDARAAAVKRISALAFGWWRATARVVRSYAAMSKRSELRAAETRKRTVFRSWARATHLEMASRCCARIRRSRARASLLHQSFRRWRIGALCAAPEVLRGAMLQAAWPRLRLSCVALLSRRSACLNAAATHSRRTRQRALRAWHERSRSRRTRSVHLSRASRNRVRGHCASAMAALRRAVICRAAAAIGRQQVLAVTVASWRLRAFTLTFRQSGARAFLPDAVRVSVRARLLSTVFRVWRAAAERRACITRMLGWARRREAARTRSRAIVQWRLDAATRRAVNIPAQYVEQRTRTLELRAYFRRWQLEDACSGQLRALCRAAWIHWRGRASHGAFGSWRLRCLREAAWNALLGAVLHSRLIRTRAGRLSLAHADAPADRRPTPALASKALADQRERRRGPVWTRVRLGCAVAAMGRERVLNGALQAWRREWHLARRFVRVSALRSAPLLTPHDALVMARRAFQEWRAWRWVYVQERESVALAFCTWYLRGRAIQLAMPITRDGSAQSPAIFWTGAAPIRDLLFTS